MIMYMDEDYIKLKAEIAKLEEDKVKYEMIVNSLSLKNIGMDKIFDEKIEQINQSIKDIELKLQKYTS